MLIFWRINLLSVGGIGRWYKGAQGERCGRFDRGVQSKSCPKRTSQNFWSGRGKITVDQTSKVRFWRWSNKLFDWYSSVFTESNRFHIIKSFILNLLTHREELARQNYQRLQLECKTDQAQKDLARLAIIRKKREEEAARNQGGPAPK